jgi:hypothetical protein
MRELDAQFFSPVRRMLDRRGPLCQSTLLLAGAQWVANRPPATSAEGRFLDSILFVGHFNDAEMFGMTADYIDTPAGHTQSISNKRCASITVTIFWDATIAIATATMVVEIIASLKWAFS